MLFTELARALVRALDAWAATVGQATDTDKRPTRASLIAELERDGRELERRGKARRKIDEPLLAYWLKGRDQLIVGRKRNRLPSEEDSAAIARVLAEKAKHSAEQLPKIGAEIADLARRLKDEGGTGWRDEVLASLTREASPSGDVGPENTADSHSSATAVAPLPAVEAPRGIPGSPEALPGSTMPAAASTVTAGEDTSVSPPPATDGDSPGDLSPDGRGRPWRDQPTWVKASLGALAVVVAAAAVIVTVAVVGPDGDRGAGNDSEGVAPQSSPSASMASTAQGGPGAVPSESPGLEKGTLGEDSRCSVPFVGPGAVAWRVCARVEAERVSFALKITNHGSKATTVKIRLEYVQASAFHQCPKAPSTHPLDVAAGETVITDSGQCTVTREETPFAYQGAGWVLAEDANAGSYKLSPTANVYPDRVTWQPDLV
ncbi:hypothetical protein [Streptomyces chartreusis]|uniref:hypothetical protein n=1 Tax=Streptomyces chartreusis TaxID=1969 RepID=UPI0037A04404